MTSRPKPEDAGQPTSPHKRAWAKASLELKIIVIALLAVVLPSGTFVTIGAARSAEALTDAIAQDLEEKAVLVARDLDHFITERISDARILSQADVLEGTNTAKIIQYLTEIIEAAPSINDADMLDRSGTIIASSEGQDEVGAPIWDLFPESKTLFTACRSATQGQVFVSEAQQLDTGPGVLFMTPITDDSNTILIGALALEVNLNNIRDIVSVFNKGVIGDKYVYIVDKHTRVLVTENPSVSTFGALPDIEVHPLLQDALSAQGEVGTTIYNDHANDRVMAGYADMAEFGENQALDWSIVAIAPLNEITHPVQQTRNLLFLAGAIIAGISLLIVYRLITTATTSLKKIATHADRIAEGDFSQRLPEEDQSGGTISTLAHAFNQMAQRIDDREQSLVHINQQLTQANEKTRTSEETLRDAQRMAKLGRWELDHKTNALHWSKITYEIFEITPDQFGGSLEAFMHIVHPDDREHVEREFAQALNTQTAYKVTHRLLMPDGRIKWVNERARTEYDRDGSPLRSIGVVQDITEQKKTEERLRVSEQRSMAYLENSPACTKIVDLDFNLQYMSQSGIIGLHIDNIDDFYGKPYPFYFYPDSFKIPMTQNLNKAKETGETITQEASVVDIDGNELWFHSTIVPVFDDADQLEYLMVVSIDTTDRKQAEKKLLESEENLSITLNSIGDAVIATDYAGLITRINPVAEHLTGWPANEAIGHKLSDVFSITNALTGEACPNPAERVLECGEIVGLANHTVLTSRDGEERQIADSGAPIKNQQGQITGVVLVFRDVTEQYKLEEQVRQSEKMQAIGQLAGGIAHDFNNQLSAILGYSEILINELNDEQLLKDAAIIRDGALRSASLTEQLLAFSRKGKHLSAPISIHKVIRDVIDILEHSIDKRIKIQQRLQADPEKTLGDPNQLQNAILNIALNARDAMPGGGKLIFETSVVDLNESFLQGHPYEIDPGTYLMISMTDNGCGMDADTQKHIFEPFYTTKDVGQGTGMGLASVYGTIRNHQGSITVYSEVGRGTTFHIYLPLTEQPQPAQLIEKQNKPITGTARILVVDDEEVLRGFLTNVLKTLGYHVNSCENGREAVEFYKEAWMDIDLVILDMIMPELGGRETFARMKEINPDVRVILSSGYNINDEAQAILNEGVMDFIGKPYSVMDLSQKVAHVLHGKAPTVEGDSS